MRMFLVMTVMLVTVGGGCDETTHSSFYDLGGQGFLHIGEACKPDVAPTSECGYAPQFYCSASGICASACNTTADCTDGAVCVGSGDMAAGECRLPEKPVDGGQD